MAGERILVIDDQPASRTFLVDDVLSPRGYRTAVAADGPQAVRQVGDVPPQLILLNACDKDVDYLAMLQLLRQEGVTAPAIVVLRREAQALDLRALQLGVHDVLQPPLTVETVERAIERALLPLQLQQACVRLEQQLRGEIEEERKLYAVGQALTTQIGNRQLYTRLVEAAVFLAGADEGALYLRGINTGGVRLVARLEVGQGAAQAANQTVRDPWVTHALSSSTPSILSATPATIDVPLRLRDQTRGVLRVSRCSSDEAFDTRAFHRLSVLTSYAALAMENAHLLDAIQDAIERTAICQIGAFLAAKLRLSEVREMVMDVAVRILGADEGHIVLVSDDTRPDGLDPRGLEEAQISPRQRVVRQVLDERRPTIAVVRDPPATGAASSVLCVPIEGDSRLFGAICLERMDITRPFSAHHRSMLTSLAANAAMALENARLFHQIEAEGRKLDAVLQGTRQPVIVTDGEGKIVLINRAARRALDIHDEESAGDGPQQVVDHPGLTPLLDQALLSGEVQYAEVHARDEHVFSATVTPIPSVGLVTVLQDITEIKRLSQLKTEFVSTVSHDIRSPLSVVQGFLAVLGQAGPLNERQLDFVASAQSELMYLFDLTADLIDLGQVESGIDLDMSPCDLIRIVDIAVRSWQGPSENRKHQLTASLPDHELFVQGNAALLRRAVDNLLSNAVKYTPPGGRIDVRLRQAGREAVIQVQDTGIGISPEDQPYVFDRFYRARDRITRNIRGTGLGLSIVRSVVDRHGGRVWLESEPGVGTTVRIALPIDDR